MKKILLPLLVIFLADINVNGQLHRAFFNANGQIVDSANAKSYLIFYKVSDTAWLAKLHAMNDTLIFIGTYKDSTLNTPNGRFTYYTKTSFKGMKVSGVKPEDTINHITKIGSYKDGVKTGPWTDYSVKGHMAYIYTYQNDKLNGLFESYRYEPNTVLIRGNYIDDKKEGEWNTLDIRGNVIATDIYEHGSIKKSYSSPPAIKGAVAPSNFDNFIYHAVRGVITSDLKGEVTIAFTITTDGKLVNPHVEIAGFDAKTDAKLLAAISTSPVWKPAYNTASKQNIEDFGSLVIKANYGIIEIKNVIINDQLKGKYYQLTH